MSSQLASRLLEELNSPSPTVRREAAKTLGNIAERSAIPALIDHLADGDPDVEEAATEALSKLRGREVAVRLIPMLAIEHVVMRNRAIQLLRIVGADAPEILLRLLQDGDRDQRIFCADILGSIKIAGAVKALTSALKDNDPNVRATAADSLGKIGSASAVKPLLNQLHDEEWVQYSVVQALSNIGDSSAIAPLLQHLDTASELVQVRIVEALGDLSDPLIVKPLLSRIADADGMLLTALCGALVKTADKKTLSTLEPELKEKLDTGLWDALNDMNENVQALALKGLTMIADTSSIYNILDLARNTESSRLLELIYDTLLAVGSLAPLVGASKSADPRLAMVAVTVLSRMKGPEPNAALINALEHPSASVRAKAAAGLGDRGNTAAGPKLMKLLADDEPNVILESARALGKLHFENAVPLLAQLLGHDHKDIRRQAMKSMLQAGGADLIDIFSKGLRHSNSNHRRMAARAIGTLAAPNSCNLLRGLLFDEDSSVRRVTVWALLQADSDEKALGHMLPLLNDPSVSVRRALITALAETGNADAHTILIKFLDDEDQDLRLHAVRSLGLTESNEAVLPLMEMLGAEDNATKSAAAKALGRIKDHRAIPSLLGLLANPSPEVRAIADAAIQIIEGRI